MRMTRGPHVTCYLPAVLSWNVKLRVDTPRPPDLVCSTTGPEPLQASVTTTSLAGLWYSRVESNSQPQILIDTMSSRDKPRLQPRTVMRVPPEEGPDFGDSPVISGVWLEESTWPRVGARRGLKRVRGTRFVPLEDEVGDNSTRDFSDSPSAFSPGRVHKFSIDLDPFLEIEAFAIEVLRFDRSFVPETDLRLKGSKLFHLPPSPVEELFLNESTQQSIQRSPIAWAFFAVNGIHRRRCATEGIWASGRLTEPRTSSLSITVKTSAAALVTLLREKQQTVLENDRNCKNRLSTSYQSQVVNASCGTLDSLILVITVKTSTKVNLGHSNTLT